MRITKSLLWSFLAAAASALPASTLHLDDANAQPALAYPIGQSNGTNAKVAGRLFEVDGKVQYFAGQC